MSDSTENKSGWIKLDRGKRKKNEPLVEEKVEDKESELQRIMMAMTPTVTPKDIEEIKERMTESDCMMSIISQRQEKGMANLGGRVGDLEEQMVSLNTKVDDRLGNLNDRMVDVEKATKDVDAQIQSESRRLDARCNTLLDRVVGTEKGLDGLGECVNSHELRLRSDQVQIGLAQKMIDELRIDLTPSVDKLEELDVLRDKVRSQEAVIAELEAKVAKMESDVGETFAEAGRMIRDVKDESTQKVEEIAKEMETRLMERAQEDADAKLKEATRIQNKDITVMKQRMENVFSRMKRVEEDPSIKAMKLEIEHMGREMKSIMWVAAGALVSALALGIVTILGFAGGF